MGHCASWLLPQLTVWRIYRIGPRVGKYTLERATVWENVEWTEIGGCSLASIHPVLFLGCSSNIQIP